MTSVCNKLNRCKDLIHFVIGNIGAEKCVDLCTVICNYALGDVCIVDIDNALNNLTAAKKIYQFASTVNCRKCIYCRKTLFKFCGAFVTDSDCFRGLSYAFGCKICFTY